MQRKKLASSKSKSQTLTDRQYPACIRCQRDPVAPGARDYCNRCLGELNKAIAEAVSSQSEPPSEPALCSGASDAAEVVITKNSGFWCTMFGSHKSPILDEKKKPFPDRDDPVMVAKYLASHARGPINVIWW